MQLRRLVNNTLPVRKDERRVTDRSAKYVYFGRYSCRYEVIRYGTDKFFLSDEKEPTYDNVLAKERGVARKNSLRFRSLSVDELKEGRAQKIAAGLNDERILRRINRVEKVASGIKHALVVGAIGAAAIMHFSSDEEPAPFNLGTRVTTCEVTKVFEPVPAPGEQPAAPDDALASRICVVDDKYYAAFVPVIEP